MSDAIWLRSYPPGVPASIDPDKYASVQAMLLDACRRFADRPAFSCLGTAVTYSAWERRSAAFAGFLTETLGCKPGDRLAVMLPNVIAYPVALLGALRAGLVIVNVNPLYTPRELEHQLTDSGSSAIVIMENFAHRLEAAIAHTPVKHVIVSRIGDFMPAPRRILFNFVNSRIRRAVPPFKFPRFTMMQAAASRAPSTKPLPGDRAAPAGPALLQYTGGTTGVPKGAMLSHRNLVANTLQCRAWVGSTVEEGSARILTPLPLYHIFSFTANLLTFSCLGGLNVLVPDPRDLKGLIATMRHSRVTAMTGVNTLFNALVNSAEFAKLDFSGLKFSMGGGAALQQAVVARWQAITGTPLIEGYGLSEASPVVCINPLNSAARTGFVGLPIPSTEVSIRDEHGEAVPVGEGGEVWVKGPQVMQGYWDKPEETSKVMTADGWLLTGDIGAMEPDGFVKLLDRKKDMIIVSGFKVFPNEVEDVVGQHPDVLEAAVVGVPDERTGQGVALFVVRRNPGLTEEGIRTYCRENLAAYKVPKRIEFRNQLPKSNIGKILRKELR